MKEIYRIKDLEHRYNRKPVLNIPELSITEGTVTGVTGPNGSGKTTLLHILAFIERPFKGEIFFQGNKINRTINPSQRRNISLLLQEPYLLKRSVFENVAYGLSIRGYRKDIKRQVKEALSWVGLAPDFCHRKWYELSGGEAQRVALAARLVLKPKVLILDEPTASIDAKSAYLIRQAIIKAKQDWGATLIIASHNHHWLDQLSEYTIFLFDGKIVNSEFINIIFGPFETEPDGTRRKWFADGQSILFNPPSSDNLNVAIIDPSKIQISIDPLRHEINSLKGTIQTISYHETTDSFLVVVDIAGEYFNIRVPSHRLKKLSIWPSDMIYFGFKPDIVLWL